MTLSTADRRRLLESLDRTALAEHQLRRLNALLDAILPENAFYARKLSHIRRPVESLDELSDWPMTYKEELADASEGGLAANLTWPRDQYMRWHQTSGTRGRPLVVLDTADDWQWWLAGWQFVLDAAEVAAGDTVFLAFSFGPFIGFWSACDAAAARGCLVVSGGGLSSLARLELMRTSGASVLLCTPSYALRLAEVATEQNINLAGLGVRRIIVAGEPGGSLPSVRNRIEAAWETRVIDHAGATEVGPWGYADRGRHGLHVNESEFLAEFVALDAARPAADGELAELVVTSLGRTGAPVIRYRTGDVVRPRWSNEGPNRFVLLEGGIVGRTDDMLVVRGVNVYPTAIEQILRGFPEVVDYRITVTREGSLDRLLIEIEDRLEMPARVANELRLRLGLKVDAICVPIGSLPRFEGKGRRFVDRREK
jgi:phenylacetate-CoA ligase